MNNHTQNQKPQSSIVKALASIIVLATMTACITTKDQSGIFIQPAAHDGRIITDSAMYADTAPLRIQFSDSREIEEYVLYRGTKGQAEMLFAETSALNAHNTALDFNKLIADSAKMWRFNHGQKLEFGESVSINTDIAMFWVQPYRQTSSGRQCVGFSSQWDIRDDDPQFRPSKVLFGYHCSPNGQSLSSKDGIAFVKSIDIRGISAPGTIRSAYDLQKQSAPAPNRDAQVSNLVLAQDGGGGGVAGLPDFPLLIARTFHDFDGPCNGC